MNENALVKAGRTIFTRTFSADKVVEAHWDIGNEDIINEIKLITTYESEPDNYVYGIGTITLANPINVKEISKDEIESTIKNSLKDATYSKDYSFGYLVSLQKEKANLTNEIFKACGHDLINNNSIRLIVDNGYKTDGLGVSGETHEFKVAEITDQGVQEYTIRVTESSNDNGYIENLKKEGNFAILSQKSSTLSGNFVKEMAQKEDISTTANFIKFNKL